jgi:hypothetical protein
MHKLDVNWMHEKVYKMEPLFLVVLFMLPVTLFLFLRCSYY